jgi:hypothetical protein
MYPPTLEQFERLQPVITSAIRNTGIISIGNQNMKRTSLTSLIGGAFALCASAVLAVADTGSITLTVIKAGFVIGGSIGNGTLVFHGRRYPLTLGGLSYGFTFGGSQTTLRGRVRNIRRPSDVEGVYGAGSAGAAIVRGPEAVVLVNHKGAVLEVSGIQRGLILNLDLSGLALSLR